MEDVRPKLLSKFLGQSSIVKQVSIAMASAKARECSFPHMIMGGPPGLGKTTLASVIANEMGGTIISRIASAITKSEDLVSLFEQIECLDTIIFIDE
ncbi:MAG: AAA family ATPase, partial [Dehalococcoidia bacterium]